MSAQNGYVLFEQLPGHANEASWLIFKKHPERIKAVSAKVVVRECTGDVRAEITGVAGEDKDGNLIWKSLQLVPDSNQIFTWIGALPPDFSSLKYVLSTSKF